MPPLSRGVHLYLGQVSAQVLELGRLALRFYIAARMKRGPRRSIYIHKF